MKKIFIFILFLSPIFLFANTDKQPEKLDEGKYVARFHVTYTERNILLPINVKINIWLCHGDSRNSNRLHSIAKRIV